MVKGKVEQILITKDEIATRVAELGRKITEDYRGRDLLIVGILKGAIVFYSDLCRSIDLPVKMDFMSVSSYGAGTVSSGIVKINKDLDHSCEGVDVLIVEDIIDSGLTLQYLKEYLISRQVRSLKVCCLLDKPERRKCNLVPDYCGFQIPDAFVVGYGLDYAEYFRNLPDIGILNPDA